jgi:hypothetical protein
MTTTLQTLAAEMSGAFEGAVRPTSGEKFRKLIDDAPEWMTTVCRKVHADVPMPADDWRYKFIEQAVHALAVHEDADHARDSLKPDYYTSNLTAWLHSQNSRVYYLGDAMRECGTSKDGFRLLAAAQLQEKLETFEQVLSALREEAASRDGSGETDESEEV